MKRLFKFLLLLIFLLPLCKGKEEGTTGGKSAEEKFEFKFFYTEGISQITCFSAELIEISPGNVLTPVFSGFFVLKLGEQKSVEIQDAKVRNPYDGAMIEDGMGTIEVFQNFLSVSISTPFPPQRFSYFEIRGFILEPSLSCKDAYKTFLESPTSAYISAIGRTSIIDPKEIRKSVGILTLVGTSDTFQTNLTSTRAFPMVVELYRDERTTLRKFLLCGGIDETTKSVLRTCDILDEENMMIEKGPVMNFPRVFGAMSKSINGKILVSGGLDRNLNLIPYSETYNPDFGVFLNVKRVLPRFSHFIFSTENNFGILGGIGGSGVWEKSVEIFPSAQTGEMKNIKLLYFLENAGKFGSCFSESQDNVYLTGGVGAQPQIMIIKKERIDAGTLEVKTIDINSAKLISPSRLTELTDYGKLSFPSFVKKLGKDEIKFGNCKAVYFENLLVVATSYGKIYFIKLSKDELADAFPDDPETDILGIEIPPSSKEFPFALRKSKKGFSLYKVSEDKAVLLGGYDYVYFSEGNTRAVLPSDEVLLISGTEISRYKLKISRQGPFSFLFEDEFLVILGGSKEGKAEVIFVGNIEYPEKIKTIGIPVKEEKKEEKTGEGEQ